MLAILLFGRRYVLGTAGKTKNDGDIDYVYFGNHHFVDLPLNST